MKKKQIFRLLALALSLLLICTACGQKAAADVSGSTPGTAQEQTAADSKKDTAKSKNKAADDKNPDAEKSAEAQKAEEEKKKAEEQKKTEADVKQDEPAAQPEQPKQEIDPTTGKDKYQTDPVPEGKPIPVEPGTASGGGSAACTISISCATILDNWDLCDESKKSLVPADGVILSATTVTFTEGESVFDVLKRICKQNGIHMESSWTPMYNSAYVEGINNLYEFDVGRLSGWMYEVNGWFPNYGCSRYALQDGDVVNWVYTCDLGYDVGGGYSTGN